jgi:hypothetical protein
LTHGREKKRALSVYLRPSLIAAVKAAAKMDRRSFSNYVEHQLERTLPTTTIPTLTEAV